jgi:hypothetical protein
MFMSSYALTEVADMTHVSVAAQVGRGVRVALVGVVAAVLLVAGVDWLWHVLPATGAYARLVGDPAIKVAVPLPTGPTTAPVYEASGTSSPKQVRQAMGGGEVTVTEGWLMWSGSSDMTPLAVMERLQPQLSWQASQTDGATFVAPGGTTGTTASGPLTGYTATSGASNSYATFVTRDSRVVHAWIPATRIDIAGSTPVIPAAEALDDLRHHRANAYPTGTDALPTLVRWWRAQPAYELPPVTEVELVHVADPADPSRSVPAWVFGEAGQAIATP